MERQWPPALPSPQEQRTGGPSPSGNWPWATLAVLGHRKVSIISWAAGSTDNAGLSWPLDTEDEERLGDSTEGSFIPGAGQARTALAL